MLLTKKQYFYNGIIQLRYVNALRSRARILPLVAIVLQDAFTFFIYFDYFKKRAYIETYIDLFQDK